MFVGSESEMEFRQLGIAISLGTFILSSCCSNGNAAESWADLNLQVRDGLELWLDATHATGDTTPPGDGKLIQWQDASGKKRHLTPPNAESQPTLLKVGGAGIVRF